jgi:hypothetical protein
MKNVIKKLGKVLFYFLVVMGILFACETAFGLMNQSNTLYFLGGLLILVIIAFTIVGLSLEGYGYIKTLTKNKNQENEL